MSGRDDRSLWVGFSVVLVLLLGIVSASTTDRIRELQRQVETLKVSLEQRVEKHEETKVELDKAYVVIDELRETVYELKYDIASSADTVGADRARTVRVTDTDATGEPLCGKKAY